MNDKLPVSPANVAVSDEAKHEEASPSEQPPSSTSPPDVAQPVPASGGPAAEETPEERLKRHAADRKQFFSAEDVSKHLASLPPLSRQLGKISTTYLNESVLRHHDAALAAEEGKSGEGGSGHPGGQPFDPAAFDAEAAKSRGAMREMHASKRSQAEEVTEVDDASIDRYIFVTLGIMFVLTFLLVLLAYTVWDETFILDGDKWLRVDKKLAWAIPVAIVGYLCVWSFSAFLRWQLLVHLGFNRDERIAIFSNRQVWNMKRLQIRHPKAHMKFADGIPRKGNHILTSIFSLIFLAGVIEGEARVAAQFALILQLFNVAINVLMMNANHIPGTSRLPPLSYALFGSSCRMRDGKLGRKNLIVVRITSLFAYFMVSVISSAFEADLTEKERQAALFFIFAPTALGDALGEVIGSLWGRHQYKVVGIGEINFKSYEGTLAVFLGAFLPMVIVSGIVDIMDWEVFAVALIMSVSSALVEAWSPRATDNMTLPVTNALWLWFFVRRGMYPANCPINGTCNESDED